MSQCIKLPHPPPHTHTHSPPATHLPPPPTPICLVWAVQAENKSLCVYITACVHGPVTVFSSMSVDFWYLNMGWITSQKHSVFHLYSACVRKIKHLCLNPDVIKSFFVCFFFGPILECFMLLQQSAWLSCYIEDICSQIFILYTSVLIFQTFVVFTLFCFLLEKCNFLNAFITQMCACTFTYRYRFAPFHP